MIRIVIATALALLLSACASSGYRDRGYDARDGYARCAACGTVDKIERVYGGSRQTTGSGAVLGAIVGGVLGNTVGKGDGRKAATVVGALAGGVIGNEVERDNNRGPYFELFLTMDDGRRIVVRQREIGSIRDGARVIIRSGEVYLR